MENYTLIILVALFLGILGVIAMLERRRRTELAQFEQLHQMLTACFGSLQASNEARLVQTVVALSQVRETLEASVKNSAESSSKLSNEIIHAIENATNRHAALLQQQVAQDSTLVNVANKLVDKLSVVSAAQAKELLIEVQRMTKAVENLKASLEESVKF